MAALSVQTLSGFTALNYTLGAIASGDTVANDGSTILVFLNANASARTLTIPGNAVDRAGLGTISVADMTETFTIPGSGTNGGRCMIPLLPTDRFNSSAGVATLNFDAVTDLTVAAIRVRRPA